MQLNALGIAAEVGNLIPAHRMNGVARHMPDEWLDAFCAAGTPEQAARGAQRLVAAGAVSIVFQPLDGDPDCLEEYRRYLMPQLKALA